MYLIRDPFGYDLDCCIWERCGYIAVTGASWGSILFSVLSTVQWFEKQQNGSSIGFILNPSKHFKDPFFIP